VVAAVATAALPLGAVAPAAVVVKVPRVAVTASAAGA